jgi:HAE1 family hydrophobic/amphiphilic exporter-1
VAASSAICAAVSARVGLVVVGVLTWPFVKLALFAADLFQAGWRPIERAYARVLAGVLRRPALVIGLALGLFAVAVGLLGRVGSELIPEVHQGRFTVALDLPVGTPLPTTLAVAEQAERQAAAHPEVQSVYATIGADPRAESSSDEGSHTARLRVQLRPGGELQEREERAAEALRATLAAPRATLHIAQPTLFSFETPVEVTVYGYDLDALRAAGERVSGLVRELPGVRDVTSSLQSGNPEVQIVYDRDQLRRFGLDPATVADRVRDKVQGVEATRIQRGDEGIALKVQLVEADRGTLRDLRRINVNPQVNPLIPLDAVAEVIEAEGPSEIRRIDQQRAVVISANLEGFDLGGTASALADALDDAGLPPELRAEIGGQSREMEGSLASLQFALALAVFLVYVIMASTFENVVHPLVILFSVPLAVSGVAGVLWLTGTPVSVVVLIGAIVLAGVVVNNAIVLVDTVNRLREDGLDRHSALQRAGELRLRPILITTATTVLGLVPLALGFGAGAEVQRPLALTVIGGLSSSTLLTLLVVPVVYAAVTAREERAA